MRLQNSGWKRARPYQTLEKSHRPTQRPLSAHNMRLCAHTRGLVGGSMPWATLGKNWNNSYQDLQTTRSNRHCKCCPSTKHYPLHCTTLHCPLQHFCMGQRSPMIRQLCPHGQQLRSTPVTWQQPATAWRRGLDKVAQLRHQQNMTPSLCNQT